MDQDEGWEEITRSQGTQTDGIAHSLYVVQANVQLALDVLLKVNAALKCFPQ